MNTFITQKLLTLKCLFATILLYTNLTQAQSPADDFVTVWDLRIAGGSISNFSFGVVTDGTVSYSWETIPAGTSGSGSFIGTEAIITGLPIFTLIRLRIHPNNFKRIHINNGINKNRLVNVEKWGNVEWTSMENAFSGCSNLEITSIDKPNLYGVTNMTFMFGECKNLNGPSNINEWDLSKVSNLSSMFQDAISFNQPIGNWNTTNVKEMGGVFYNAKSFNQPLENWNTSSVENMSLMFYKAISFNQSLQYPPFTGLKLA